MFFRWLGELTARFWWLLIAVWIGAYLVLRMLAPDWNDVATDGEFQHLPHDSPTHVGGTLYDAAFPNELTDSTIAILLRRPKAQLAPEDFSFIANELSPALYKLADDLGGLVRRNALAEEIDQIVDATAKAAEEEGLVEGALAQRIGQIADERLGARRRQPIDKDEIEGESAADTPRIIAIRTYRNSLVGPLLTSADGRATMVLVELPTEFLETRNDPVVRQIEEIIDALHKLGKVPDGLQIELTGSATVGRDTIVAVTQSTDAVERWTVWLVVGLLLLVYRAPIAAAIPLLTVWLAVEITIHILAILAGRGIISVFDGLKLYATVIIYGAGVDYSLFLIARYEEELSTGKRTRDAVVTTIAMVGVAVAASAGTEMFGVGMLMFAEFGQFQQAGMAVALGLAIMLAASLTLTPSMVRLLRRWGFWPLAISRRRGPAEPLRRKDGLPAEAGWFGRVWDYLGRLQRRRPAAVWLATFAAMLPLALVGLWNFNNLSYGLITDLPDELPSVRGTAMLHEHFPVGLTGPVTVLVRDDRFNFASDEGVRAVQSLSDDLLRRRKELWIADFRHLADPVGISARADELVAGVARALPASGLRGGEDLVSPQGKQGRIGEFLERVARDLSFDHYVSQTRKYQGHVTRMEITLDRNPYSRETIAKLDQIDRAFRAAMPAELQQAEVHFLGGTASLRDLKTVAERDRRMMMILVTAAVLVVLVVLLRRIALPIYLIVSVFFTFLVAYGTTYLVFWALDPRGFVGLDWTVPVFLFTLLVAVGEDYSVFLVTRIDEEQERLGPIEGITHALTLTGGLISGAGVIMAGTFAALALGGILESLLQLGFALSFGVLLDTFIVRPLMVPSYLILVNTGRFGWLSRYLGAYQGPRSLPPQRQEAA